MRLLRSTRPNNAAKIIAGAFAAAALGGVPAMAAPFMTLGGVAPAPLAYLDFCLRHSDQCLIPQATAAAATPLAPPSRSAEPVAALGEAPAEPAATSVVAIFARRADTLPKYEVRIAATPLQGRRLDVWRARFVAPMAGAVIASPQVSSTVASPLWAARRESSFAVRLAQAATASPAAAPSGEVSISLAEAAQSIRAPETTELNGAVVRSTPQFLALLQQVNRTINSAIIKKDDMSSRGLPDHWDLPLADGGKPYGDCEDFVLEKRRALVAQGVSPRALSMAIARTRRGELHAVLVVTTDQGELILDNLSPWVTPWAELNYTWIQRQVAGDAFKWAVIAG